MNTLLKLFRRSVDICRRLPFQLAVPFYILLIVPIWSAFFVTNPLQLMQGPMGIPSIMVASTYFILPWVVCALVIARSFWIFPMLALLALGLFLHTTQYVDLGSTSLKFVQVALIAGMSLIGFLVLQKDVVVPFISGRKRFWRSETRINANKKVKVRLADGTELRGIIVDASLHGLGVTLGRTGDGTRHRITKGDQLVIESDVNKQPLELDGAVAWLSPHEEFDLLGIRVQSESSQLALLRSLHGDLNRQGLFSFFVTNLKLRRHLTVAWGLSMATAFGFPACGQQETNKGNQRSGVQSVSGEATAAEVAENIQGLEKKPRGKVKKDVSTKHGFGGNAGSKVITGDGKLVEVDDIEDIEELRERRVKITSQIYSGDALNKVLCDGSALGSNENMAPTAMFSHQTILDLFAPQNKGEEWLRQYFTSLSESDPMGIARPKSPVIPNLLSSFTNGLEPSAYKLTAVRFRFPDNDHTHIKLNYTLDAIAANVSLVESAQLIYAIAVPPELRQELLLDLSEVPQDPLRSGCSLSAVLKKYIPIGDFMFVHSNLFVPEPSATDMMMMTGMSIQHGWFLTEGRPVVETDDHLDMNRSWLASQVDQWCHDGELDPGFSPMVQADPFFIPSGATNPPMESEATEEEGTCEEQVARGLGITNMNFDRTVIRPWDDAPFSVRDQAKLRIVKMAFPQVTPDEDGKPTPTGSVFEIWASNEIIEEAEPLPIAVDSDGARLAEDHPIYAFDEAYTCAECHNRRFGVDVDPETERLMASPDMKMRHIGYGDTSGIADFDPMFAIMRSKRYVALSAFMVRTADPLGLYYGGKAPDWSTPYVSPSPEEVADIKTLLCGVVGLAKTSDDECKQIRQSVRAWWAHQNINHPLSTAVMGRGSERSEEAQEDEIPAYKSCSPFQGCACSSEDKTAAQLCFHDAVLGKLRPDMAPHIAIDDVVFNAKRVGILPKKLNLDLLRRAGAFDSEKIKSIIQSIETSDQNQEVHVFDPVATTIPSPSPFASPMPSFSPMPSPSPEAIE